ELAGHYVRCLHIHNNDRELQRGGMTFRRWIAALFSLACPPPHWLLALPAHAPRTSATWTPTVISGAPSASSIPSVRGRRRRRSSRRGSPPASSSPTPGARG